MDYKEALKKVQAAKARGVYMIIQLDWNKKLVLPHQDGIALLTALANAEQLVSKHGEKPRIAGIEQDAFNTTLMSREDYERYKIAALLNLSIDDVKTLELQTPEPQAATA